ncbi:MAG: hypothetical protein AAF740_03680 [Bacteroidota bacterium]
MKTQYFNFSKLLTYLIIGWAAFTFTACGDDDEPSADTNIQNDENDPYHKDGYFVSSRVNSSAGATVYYGYFPEKPSGSIDMTQFQSSQDFRVSTQHNGFIYGRPIDGSNGVVKFGADKETNQVVEIASILELEFVQSVIIVDDNTGFYLLGAGGDAIVEFDPETMEETGRIDLSGAFDFPDDDNITGFYSTMMYNDVTNKLFVSVFLNDQRTPQFYDRNEVYVTVIDVASGSVDKTITHGNAQYPVMRGKVSNIVDEAGNTYFLAQGSYGLDGQIGPVASAASRPQILKINTSSEFDESYTFNPVNSFGFGANFFQLASSLVYGGNNKVYAPLTSVNDTTQPELTALLQKLATGTITQPEYDQLVFLVLFTPTQNWVEIDLATRNVREVIGIPKTAGFNYPFGVPTSENSVFVQYADNVTSGFYEIDVNSSTGTEVFTLSAGGTVEAFLDLAADVR